jgi:hypothetical protein
MHRLKEQHGICQILALPGPVRRLVKVKRADATGFEYEDYDWPFLPDDWEVIGRTADVNALELRPHHSLP